ncbi:Conserved hypothetical protein (acetyltransferase?) [Mycobacteroides abscessus]|nr:Conserved hypothetical protein (acetyltransferase?) [Mycobacteroides abscessus]
MTTTLPAPGAPGASSSDAVRVLGLSDTEAVRAVLDIDPVASCMLAARVEARGADPTAIGGEIWSTGVLADSLCFVGTTIIPLAGGPQATRLFAERAIEQHRICPSLVGPADVVLDMWCHLDPAWGPAREVRACQPLLAMLDAPTCVVDPAVRQVRAEELDEYLNASIQMFIGEMGVDPRNGDGGRGYRRRVAGLIEAGRAWARFEDGRVIFKAEIGSQSRSVSQIQGVWVDPEFRGRGLGTAGVAAIAAAVHRSGRIPSLYVNSFNEVARASYAKAGFSRIGTFATVLVS